MVKVEIGSILNLGLVSTTSTEGGFTMATSSHLRKTTITARLIAPAIPSNLQHRKELEDDLAFLECHELIEHPWSVKNDVMIQELLTRAPNQFELTIRDRLNTWSADQWVPVSRFEKNGLGLATQNNKYV